MEDRAQTECELEAYDSFLEEFPDSDFAEIAFEALADALASFETAAGGDTSGPDDEGGPGEEGGAY